MNLSFRDSLAFFVHFGAFGLILLTMADDSFLFLPIGPDLLMVILVARNHRELPLYVASGAVGSTMGVYLLDLVCRKGGEEGLKRLIKPGRLEALKQRMRKHAALIVIISCLAPPPFPFGVYIAAASALQYPKPRLLALVFGARAIRFALVGWAAIYFGRGILKITNSSEFARGITGFIAFCVIGSIISAIRWFRLQTNGMDASVRHRAA